MPTTDDYAEAVLLAQISDLERRHEQRAIREGRKERYSAERAAVFGRFSKEAQASVRKGRMCAMLLANHETWKKMWWSPIEPEWAGKSLWRENLWGTIDGLLAVYKEDRIRKRVDSAMMERDRKAFLEYQASVRPYSFQGPVEAPVKKETIEEEPLGKEPEANLALTPRSRFRRSLGPGNPTTFAHHTPNRNPMIEALIKAEVDLQNAKRLSDSAGSDKGPPDAHSHPIKEDPIGASTAEKPQMPDQVIPPQLLPFMDNVEIPHTLLSDMQLLARPVHQPASLFSLPKHIKNWGHLKTWVNQIHGTASPKIMRVHKYQDLHYQLIVEQRMIPPEFLSAMDSAEVPPELFRAVEETFSRPVTDPLIKNWRGLKKWADVAYGPMSRQLREVIKCQAQHFESMMQQQAM